MILSWGKCQIVATPISGTGAAETAAATTFTNIVEDSTELQTTQGDKQEATIEGGEVEAVRYNRNKYLLTWQERLGSTRLQPQIPNDDGVVAGEWSVVLKPEAVGAPGFTLNRSSINVQVSYTSDGGAIATYTADALKPDTGATITWAATTA